MNFLRLLTKRVYQNITYSCFREEENDCTAELQGDNEKLLKSSEKTHPRFVQTDVKVPTVSIGILAVYNMAIVINVCGNQFFFIVSILTN